MQNKKICHISTAHSALSGRLLDRECMKLAEAGYDTTLIAQYNKDETIGGVKIVAFPKTTSRVYRMTILNIYMLYKALKQKAKLYHFHDPELMFVGFVLKLLGKKVVYDVHEDLPKQIYNKPYLNKKVAPYISGFVAKVEVFFAKRFDGLVTVVPSIEKRLLKSNANTIMYRNFPEMKLVDSAEPKRRDDDKFRIIYPGSLSKVRGVEDIINVVGMYEGSVELILGGRWSHKGFEEHCKNLKGWKYVKYLGRLPQKEVYEYMKSANLGVHIIHDKLSHRIGYPMKAFEFMACRVPFLISGIGNKRGLFEGTALFVEPQNLEDIKQKIDMLKQDKELGIKLANTGRKKAEEVYNLENEVDRLLKFYENIFE